MRLVQVRVSGLMLATLAVATAPQLSAQQNGSGGTPTLEERVDELDQQIRILQRLRELAADSAATAAKTATKAQASKDGFNLKSADGAYSLRFRGYIQADGRFFPSVEVPGTTDNLLLRRARPILEATVGRYFDFRLMPDFGGTSPAIFDAYWEGKFVPAFTVRAGQVQAARRHRAASVGHRHQLRRAWLSDQPRAQPRYRSPGRG